MLSQNKILILLLLFVLCCAPNMAATTSAPAAGGAQAEAMEAIAMTSASITTDGRLLTLCAASKGPNHPRGENQSPQLSFTPVDGAAIYAILMFDTDANWLHFAVTDVVEAELPQGQYTDPKQYVGPYPPKGTGDHHYQIEVFALKATPDKPAYKMDKRNDYQKVVDSLDVSGGEPGNILLRGSIVALYGYGDDTVE